ncbi:hypothetical protein HBH56_236390 [Parastagonospora nodorum]|uniref:Uncharacterized protein n=1 Tax=Phaeosphaeria nodorum (strain SN15 / ATCC MYA-4574 / FGSC 10173) TaxID=321614 RepID=A0A7U2HWS6_PHANO|nr:hypothetical protein HBH56_236390 [Parastagonospora nodorum]QRC90927.1 hypothetical protein JI435_400740 [Parastagonospora nodorum SN15]KAH3935150.1 hypothetical protein HBH54_046340 [Parastagonospora nodorum]KAH3950299.1 hypothetical protein HBH53_077620 [Parastagonospora nodorum]KAH3987056.1 hypothetical protein HBH51_010670 [Parastagonospora nodorum]
MPCAGRLHPPHVNQKWRCASAIRVLYPTCANGRPRCGVAVSLLVSRTCVCICKYTSICEYSMSVYGVTRVHGVTLCIWTRRICVSCRLSQMSMGVLGCGMIWLGAMEH